MSTTDRFGLRPFMLDGVQVGRIRRKIFESHSGLVNSCLNILSFMKGGVIHNKDGSFRNFWQQILDYPRLKAIAINISVVKTRGKEGMVVKSTNDIGSSLGVPVVFPNTAFSFEGI